MRGDRLDERERTILQLVARILVVVLVKVYAVVDLMCVTYPGLPDRGNTCTCICYSIRYDTTASLNQNFHYLARCAIFVRRPNSSNKRLKDVLRDFNEFLLLNNPPSPL